VTFRWVRLPSEFRAYLCLFGYSVFLSVLFNASLNVRMLECDTEIPYLDEQIKLVFKFHDYLVPGKHFQDLVGTW